MMKRILPFLALICGLLWSQAAEASHFRYGTITWVVPDPQAAPLTVRFTVQTAWRFDFVNPVTNLQFGDGQQNGNAGGAIIGTGTDVAGLQYTVREYTVSHTYATAGTFTAFFADTARIAGLINGSNGPYRVETVVDLSAGNTGGPISASPAIIQMQVGGIRTYTFPIFDADSDPTACRYATAAESGLPAMGTIPTVPAGGAQPALSTGPAGCTITWDVTQAVAGQKYVLHLVLESTHGGVISSSALDLIIEMVGAPPPVCTGTGFFIAEVGMPFSTMTTGTDGAVMLTVQTINAPGTSILNPAAGTTGMSPYSTTLSWTPAASDAGSTTIVIVNYTNPQNSSGACFLTIQVPQCPDFGDPCSVGVGECFATGTNVCAGPGITVCGAVEGTPQPELCDNLDNNCDGSTDEGNPESDQACSSGLPGACDAGLTNCAAGGTLECIPTLMPGEMMETCNDFDDDCDGVDDNGFNVGMECTVGVGECAATGDIACNGMGGSDCNATPGVPGAEICGDGLDSDCDGANNNGCPDTDGDGIVDDDEDVIGTDPNDADSDDDGVIDGDEPSFDDDTDGDGLINALDPDSDDDGLYDGTELGLDCDNRATDPDANHCIADADGGTTTTDPLDPDTDNGGVSDGSEDTNLNGAIDAGETDPTSGNGADDGGNDDSDGDGLSDDLEVTLGSNPNDADTDNDGVLDGDEANPADDTDGDGLINVLDVDSDDDGLFDGTEVGNDCSNPATDTTLGHCIPDGDAGATTTSPLDADSDDGGASDGTEDWNLNGVLDPGETDPTAGNGADDTDNTDTDGDGLGDDLEGTLGTDPMDSDSDNDGVLDGDEPNPSDDHDGDGTPNSNDEDSDGDGLFDGTEVGNDCNNPDTDPAEMNCIPDGDGGATTTNPLDADTDNGGVSDGDEDTDHDGVVDPGELDPNDPVDDMGCNEDSDCGDTMSGMVCDDTGMCIDGCRGEGGNGCPTGQECTSADDSIGMCVDVGCMVDADCGGITSGMVCDPNGTCVDGCRGEGGNGCPAGQECSSVDNSIGICSEPPACMVDADCGDKSKFCDAAAHVCRDRGIYAEGNGLLCSASPGNDNDRAPWGAWILALAAGAGLYRRRRR